MKKLILVAIVGVSVQAATACHCPARPIPYHPPVYTTCHRHHHHDGILGASLNLVGSVVGAVVGTTCCEHTTTIVQPTTVVTEAPVMTRTYYTPSHLTTAMTPLVTVPNVAAGSVATAPVVPAYTVAPPVTRVWVPAQYVMHGNIPVWEPGHWMVVQ